MRQGRWKIEEAYFAVAFSSFGAIEPPSRMFLGMGSKFAIDCDVVSLGSSVLCMAFGMFLMLPSREDVKESNKNPATTMATRMEICRGICKDKKLTDE